MNKMILATTLVLASGTLCPADGGQRQVCVTTVMVDKDAKTVTASYPAERKEEAASSSAETKEAESPCLVFTIESDNKIAVTNPENVLIMGNIHLVITALLQACEVENDEAVKGILQQIQEEASGMSSMGYFGPDIGGVDMTIIAAISDLVPNDDSD